MTLSSQGISTLVITGYGTNSHEECAHATRISGCDNVDIAHFADIIARRVVIENYSFIIFPGGFLDGDDLGAAQAAAQRWKHSVDKENVSLMERLKTFINNGGLILGICNGFQLLVKLGLLPSLDNEYFSRQVSLSNNDSARYEDRWVHLAINQNSPCIFTKGLTSLAVPVRHGEGKLIPLNNQVLQRLLQENLVPVCYADPATNQSTQEYPLNPNGSPLGIAGLTDPTGRIFGLMPHPEAFNHKTNHPHWTRGETPHTGLEIFKNAISYLQKNK